MLKIKKIVPSFLFYSYAIICVFLIHTFSTIEYEWMLDDMTIKSLCDVPKGDGDRFFFFIIFLLFIPFFFVKKNKIRTITLFVIALYYAWRFLIRFHTC
ncbi:DUF2645 family protein [Samsonia erythrinae]|uniref:Uncharacterized protein DUF2645 n=1 Tax=Samsonia erythrinae TaxID=160434 RepID=A0A4R3VKQ6_9GAMM|nr:DUF2645 family protein [Samsonia erythrinae]TCV05088.1 uncharacterized protein DUF2645 [Samsonia erythrinae]